MKKFEYKAVRISTHFEYGPGETYEDRLASGLGMLGADGWELCGIVEWGCLLFKREMNLFDQIDPVEKPIGNWVTCKVCRKEFKLSGPVMCSPVCNSIYESRCDE